MYLENQDQIIILVFRHQVFWGGGGGGLGACSPRIKLKINIAGNALKLFFLPSHNFKSLGRPFWLLAGGEGYGLD